MASVEPRTTASGRASHDELVDRARDLIPVLRERGALAEELRMLPPETVEDFKQAGFLRALVPERFGRKDHDPGVRRGGPTAAMTDDQTFGL
jgi:3-hydroxy-9,10-secoandrosta-1,3,5(10)-triene-9,17-dione monooxygenase